MVLVAYSDSEGSDVDEAPKPAPKPAITSKASTATIANNFTIDKANPSKIRVNFPSTLAQNVEEREDGEPAAKRPRIGGGKNGAFSGFNAMLPAPKRDNVKPDSASSNGNKALARKVFSLKTGAEPAFSRESDAELRDLFREQEQDYSGSNEQGSTIPSEIPKPNFSAEARTSQTTNKPFMFKPLSVSRGPKKKKTASQLLKTNSVPTSESSSTLKSTGNETESRPISNVHNIQQNLPLPKQKISLFSSGPADPPPDPDLDHDDEDEIIEVLDEDDHSYTNDLSAPQSSFLPGNNQEQSDPNSLSSLATSLNLTPAERRQLLGRNHNQPSASENKIITFNTDTEYAANQAFGADSAAAAALQHNPVRAIGGGKHSLKSLVASAQGQKEALEESFAAGRKNKKEAGSKYGW